MRIVLGVIIGLVASLVTALVAGVIAGIMTLSVPAGTNANDTSQLVGILLAMPVKAQFAMGGAWFLTGLAGGYAARLVSRSDAAAWLTVLLLALYFGYNGFILALAPAIIAWWALGPLLGAFVAIRLAGRPAAAPASDQAEALPEEP